MPSAASVQNPPSSPRFSWEVRNPQSPTYAPAFHAALQVSWAADDVLLFHPQVVLARASVPGEVMHAGCAWQSWFSMVPGIDNHCVHPDLSCLHTRVFVPAAGLQPYFSEDAAVLLQHMAPLAVRQPQIPAVEAAAVQRSQLTGEASAPEPHEMAHLQAADSALQAAREAAAAAMAASAAVEALVPPAEQLRLPSTPPLMPSPPQQQQQLGSPPASTLVPSSVLQGVGTPGSTLGGTAEAPGSTSVRPPRGVRLPPSLMVEPSLPEHDLAPGRPGGKACPVFVHDLKHNRRVAL